MPSIRHTAGRLSLGEAWMLVWRSNHPSHRSAARLSPPIRKRQEGYYKKVSASVRRGVVKKVSTGAGGVF